MACGTPVLATAMAAALELIEPGVTGFTAASWSDLVERVPAAAELDRKTIRRVARRRFDAELMIDRHEALYQRIVEQRSWRIVGQRS